MTVNERAGGADLAVYAQARGYLRWAAESRHQLLSTWGGLVQDEAFSLRPATRADGTVEVGALAHLPLDAAEQLELQASETLRAVKAAMDAAVHATAQVVCSSLAPIDSDLHQMPLAASQAEFAALLDDGRLLGLRPDQVRVLEELQPYITGSDGALFVGKHMTHLAEALRRVERGEPLVCVWASSINPPEVWLPSGVTVESMDTISDGPLKPHHVVAQFRVAPADRAREVASRPNVALDPILDSPPWPADMNDNLGARTSNLLVIARHLIEALERSVSTPSLLEMLGSLDEQAPSTATDVWSPVGFADPAEEQKALDLLAGSELNLISLRDADGSHTLLRRDGDRLLGREMPQASPPDESADLGPAVERAALAAAAGLGLPDFVYNAEVIRKGSGLREIGDGTIVTGRRGIALQVKARDGATEDPVREGNWLVKKAGEALRQAQGTIRSMLADPNLQLTNMRGRTVQLPVNEIDWVPVVILDHPNPPLDVLPNREQERRGLILLRRDWEFLLDQLRSVSAVVDYAHRVADERVELGTESHRYFDLAHRDAAAQSDPPADWMTALGASQEDGPTLPSEPADSVDVVGHAVFQRILEDIAAVDFVGDEATRVEVLAMIDQMAVTHRAELGRTLLRRLDYCARAPADALLAQHRVHFLDSGRLHLSFNVYSVLTGYHRQMFETWLLHRRQTFLQVSGAKGPDYPWSVAVLLTPRPAGGRLWDTTVLATNAGPAYDEETYETIEKAFKAGDVLEPAIL